MELAAYMDSKAITETPGNCYAKNCKHKWVFEDLVEVRFFFQKAKWHFNTQ